MKNIISNVVRYYYKDIKFHKKLAILIIIVIFISILSTNVLLKSKFEKKLVDETSNTFQSMVNQYVDNINYKLSIQESVIENIATNPDLIDIFKYNKNIRMVDMVELSKDVSKWITITSMKKNLNDIYDVKLFSIQPIFEFNNGLLNNIEAEKDTRWYKTIYKQGNYGVFFKDTTQGMKIEIISMVMPITDFTSINFRSLKGLAKIDLYAHKIFNSKYLLDKNGKKRNVYIFNDKNQLIYTNNKNNIEEIKEKISSKIIDNNDMFIETIQGKKGVYIQSSNLALKYKAVVHFPYTEISNKMQGIFIYMYSIVIVLFIVMGLLTVLLSKIFFKRIYKLIDKINLVKKGEFNVYDTIEGKDEIGILDQRFNEMIKRIQTLINDNYIQKLEKREAELNALQSQINPHFLFNTLETINAICFVNDCEDACTICNNLGTILRYSIRGNSKELVKIKEEFEHVINYIEIQKMRFEDKFDVSYNLQDEISNYKMLKFILQPIVENAIYHGFDEKREKGLLIISVTEKIDVLEIVIKDDGVGIDDDKLLALNRYINGTSEQNANRRGSIGLRNVNARIKLAFGIQYGLEIQSEPNQGTKVRVTMPIIK